MISTDYFRKPPFSAIVGAMKKEIRRYVLYTLTIGLVAAASVFWGWHASQTMARSRPVVAAIPLVTALQTLRPVVPTATAASATPTPTPSPTPVITPPAVIPAVNTPVTGAVQARILMYHYVRYVDPNLDRLGYNLSVHPEELDQHLKLLSDLGYRGITMADVAAGKGDSRSVVLTFDDGYEDFYTAAYPILKKYNFTATLYIIANKIGGPYMTWDQIRELKNAGFEIGAHTLDHLDLASLSEDSQRHQIAGSKELIEQQIGAPVTAFCYPSGKYNSTTVRLVKEAGFTSATTTKPGVVRPGDDPFTYQRIRMNPDMGLDYLTQTFR